VCVKKCGKFDRTKPEESSVRCEVVRGQKLNRNLVKKICLPGNICLEIRKLEHSTFYSSHTTADFFFTPELCDSLLIAVGWLEGLLCGCQIL
jgi:hypothetical protein